MRVLYCVLVWLSSVLLAAAVSKNLYQIDEANWREVLSGEWMVEFHAPWCPACRDLQKAWHSFADWSHDLGITVAACDVTANPGLSGRFLVTALPTIYHVKDGVFRSYLGPRDKDDFMSFIEDKKWAVVQPVANWKHPATPQMAVVATFFRLSMSVRDLHNYLVGQVGLPPWASYGIFGGATLVLGCVLGFLIVCVIDCVFPAAPAVAPKGKESAKKQNKQKRKEQQAKAEAKARDSQSEQDASQHSQSDGDPEGSQSGSPQTRHRAKEAKEPEKKPMANGKTPEAKKKK